MLTFDDLLLICPVCGGEDFDLLNGDNHPQTDYRCRKCTLGIQATSNPEPLGMYDRERYDGLRSSCGPIRASWARFNHDMSVARLRMRQLAQILPDPGKHASWCDYGCGNGAMLVTARRAGFRVRGIEADPGFCNELCGVLGLSMTCTADFMEHPSVYHFDVLSMFDVLEHLVAPVDVMRHIVDNCVVPSGLVVLEVPDLSQHSGPIELSRHHKPNEHLTHWSPIALRTLFERHLPEFVEVHCEQPVPTKLQMVWRRHRS